MFLPLHLMLLHCLFPDLPTLFLIFTFHLYALFILLSVKFFPQCTLYIYILQFSLQQFENTSGCIFRFINYWISKIHTEVPLKGIMSDGGIEWVKTVWLNFFFFFYLNMVSLLQTGIHKNTLCSSTMVLEGYDRIAQSPIHSLPAHTNSYFSPLKIWTIL